MSVSYRISRIIYDSMQLFASLPSLIRNEQTESNTGCITVKNISALGNLKQCAEAVEAKNINGI